MAPSLLLCILFSVLEPKKSTTLRAIAPGLRHSAPSPPGSTRRTRRIRRESSSPCRFVSVSPVALISRKAVSKVGIVSRRCRICDDGLGETGDAGRSAEEVETAWSSNKQAPGRQRTKQRSMCCFFWCVLFLSECVKYCKYCIVL